MCLQVKWVVVLTRAKLSVLFNWLVLDSLGQGNWIKWRLFQCVFHVIAADLFTWQWQDYERRGVGVGRGSGGGEGEAHCLFCRILLATASLLLLLLSCFSRARLCDPIEGNPPSSPIPGILQARTLEWVAISVSNA